MNCIASKLEKAAIYLSQNKQKNVFILSHKRKRYCFFCLASFAVILILIGVIPLRLAIAKVRAPQPQAILMLGGSTDREYFTAQFARKHSSLDIWISSGMPPKNARELFRRIGGISESQLHVDCRAVDTVTNFTSLVSDFKNRNIEHLYLITSDYHMSRAQAIATFVLGSQGIAFTPVPVPSKEPSESLLPTIRDICRALLWIITKRTGASLNNRLIPCDQNLSVYSEVIYVRRNNLFNPKCSDEFRSLYCWFLYPWRSSLEANSLVFSRRTIVPHSLAA